MKYLKVLLVAATILISTLGAKAEIISFALSAATTDAHYKIKGYDAVSSRYGYQFGAGLTFKIPVISISPEIYYTNNQFKVTNSRVLGEVCDVRDQSIDVPIVVGFNLLAPLTLEAGPVFSVYNEARASYKGSYGSEDLGRIRPETGYVIGAKLTLFKKVEVGMRYFGQYDYYKFGGNGNYIRSHYYTLSLGYRL